MNNSKAPSMTLFMVLGWAFVLCCPRPARSQVPETFWNMPDGTVAYWAVGDHPLDGNASELVATALRSLVRNAMSIDGSSSVFDNVIRAVGTHPYRVVLLDLEAPRALPKTEIVRPTKFQAVLQVWLPQDQKAAIDAAIESGLTRDARDDRRSREQRTIDLPGGGRARVSSSGDDAWRDVSWGSTADSITIGFGRGALERWFTGKQAMQRQAAWSGQRGFIGQKRGRAPRCFEAFVDASALRQGISDEFQHGHLEPLLESLDMANARTLMIHGSLMGTDKADPAKPVGCRLIALDLSWSSRAERPGRWKWAPLSEGAWPAELGEKPQGAWAIVAQADILAWIERSVDLYESLADNVPFRAAHDRWHKRAETPLVRVSQRLAGWVVGTETGIRIPVKRADGPDRLQADLRAAFAGMEPFVVFAQRGWQLKIEDRVCFTWKLGDAAIEGAWPAEAK